MNLLLLPQITLIIHTHKFQQSHDGEQFFVGRSHVVLKGDDPWYKLLSLPILPLFEQCECNGVNCDTSPFLKMTADKNFAWRN